MEALASVFAIDVLTYAVMSNHMHQILRNRPDLVASWTDEQVAIRWLRVFPGRRLEEHLAEPTVNDVQRLAGDSERIAEIRRRLSDPSWFMRALAEPIARMANREDDCTGRFWEGRFKCQRIVDEAGLLACSMYVDLNPVRAAMAESPGACQHTGASDRAAAAEGQQMPSAAHDLVPVDTAEAGRKIRETPVEDLREERRRKRNNPTGRRVSRDAWLSPLRLDPEILSDDPQAHTDGLRGSDRGYLPIPWREYWELLCWMAGQGADSIAGLPSKVPEKFAGSLSALGIDVSMFRDLVWNWRRYFGTSLCVGGPDSMREHAEQTGRHHHRGQASIRECFG